MTTFKEFEDLGVVFVNGDRMGGDYVGTWSEADDIHFNTDPNAYFDYVVKSFAWRPLNTLPDNPKFKFEYNDGDIRAQWRPLLGQSSPVADSSVNLSEEKSVTGWVLDDLKHELSLHKANSALLMTLTEFMVKNGTGRAGESCIDVAIRELSEKHGIDTRTPKQKAVDVACKSIDYIDNPIITSIVSDLYDKGFIKTDKEV